MKTLFFKPLFLVISISYSVYYVWKEMQLPLHPFIRNYWADFCCLFLINTVILGVIREVKNQKQLELSAGQLLFSFIACTLLFEVVLPKYYTHHTADLGDVIAYFLGLLLFYFWRKQDVNQSVS